MKNQKKNTKNKKHTHHVKLLPLNPDYYWGICIECGTIIEITRKNWESKWKTSCHKLWKENKKQ